MAQYIDKDALVAEIERLEKKNNESENVYDFGTEHALKYIRSFIDTLEVKEFNVWKTVDNINPPQADRNKIYCVLTKNKLLDDKYLTASVINHPHDEDLLQWKCTEFPFRCYDMCEGDKYLQIV